jgi:D-lactate dehydrogenase
LYFKPEIHPQNLMTTVAVYDAKPFDIEFLTKAADSDRIQWRFHEFRLDVETASTAAGAGVACVFVNDRVDEPCLKRLRDLGVRHVALRCAGFNNVDLVAAKKLGIAVTRVPAYSPHAVAEHAMALLLTLARKTHRAWLRVRELNFSLNGLVGFEIYGKTAGIVGTGKIGRVVAEILHGFGVKILAYDPFPNREWAEKIGVTYTDMDNLLGASDIVSLHLPLLPETMHLLNERTLRLLKPGAFIVNTSRGKLIETKALIKALKSGRLGGVALDVYEEEAGVFYQDLSGQVLQDDELSRLLTFSNVIITSHQAFLTREALTEIARVTVENIQKGARNTPFLDETIL